MAAALFPEAQYPTRALAASSALGCGAGGTAGGAVVGGVGTGAVVGTVVVGTVVVLGARVVVACVVGASVGLELHADAVTPRTAATAAARTGRASRKVTVPL
jgi:hypothetical protein